MDLTQADRLAVVEILSKLPEFETESGRRRLMELAGLAALSPRIDLSGPPFLAAAGLLDFLIKYGRPAPESEALGMLLNVVMSLVNQERAAQIAELLRRYSMMIPVAASPVAAMVGPAFPPAVLTEKIIGENTLKPIAFLARGLAAARSVALVAVTHADQSWTGSGFLVGPDIVLTNHHVVGSAADGAATELRFDFEEDEFGVMRDYSGFGVTSVLATDAKLDFSLLEVAGRPGGTRPHLVPRRDPIRVGDRVSIIQHPGGRPKQVSLQHNLVEYVGGDVVQYVTSTLPGSSGSPVLDDDWKLVALHHAGGMLAEPTTGATYYRNEGIALSSIMDSLSPQLRQRLGWNNGGQS